MDEQFKKNGNILICNFMLEGCIVPKDGYEFYLFEKHKYWDLNYDSSWDSIMDVYKKIRNYLHTMERPSKNHCCVGDLIETDIQCYILEGEKDKIFEKLVNFVHWYNDYNKINEESV